MNKYYYHMRAALHNFFNRYVKYLLHPSRIKRDLVLRKAVAEANRLFDANGVRYFVVPTPEGLLRVISAAEAKSMIKSGFFPRRWKIQSIYSISFYWTAASRAPKHGNSLPSYANLNLFAEWWSNTHH